MNNIDPSTLCRVISIDPHNLEALKYKALYTLCRQGSYDEASQSLRELYSEMDRSEANNAILFIQAAQLFSRLVNYVLFCIDQFKRKQISSKKFTVHTEKINK